MNKRRMMEKFKEYDTKLSYQLFKSYPKSKFNRKCLKALEWSCHGIPFFACTIVSLYIWPESEILANLLVGLILDIVYIALLKASVRRRRPSYAQQDDQIVIAMDKHSFPSGHASRAIYVALLLSQVPVISLFVWIWALTVAASRVLLGRHFLTDVLGGIVLGYCAYCFQFGIGHVVNKMLLWGIHRLLGI